MRLIGQLDSKDPKTIQLFEQFLDAVKGKDMKMNPDDLLVILDAFSIGMEYVEKQETKVSKVDNKDLLETTSICPRCELSPRYSCECEDY